MCGIGVVYSVFTHFMPGSILNCFLVKMIMLCNFSLLSGATGGLSLLWMRGIVDIWSLPALWSGGFSLSL